MQNQPRKKPLNKFVRLTGIGLQMGITIYLAAYFGKRIDAHYQFEKKICDVRTDIICLYRLSLQSFGTAKKN